MVYHSRLVSSPVYPPSPHYVTGTFPQSQVYQWFGWITDEIAGVYVAASAAGAGAAADAVAGALTDAAGALIIRNQT